MKQVEKPILFSTSMVQAILAGRKTQTRRTSNIPPETHRIESEDNGNFFAMWGGYATDMDMFVDGETQVKPKYIPGDILWVRETWRLTDLRVVNGGVTAVVQYKDGVRGPTLNGLPGVQTLMWRPSMFMPKAAARIFLRVTDVRAEQVQDISPEDCIAEGICAITKDGNLYKYGVWDGDMPSLPWQDMAEDPVQAYAKLWDDINAKRDGGIHAWERNPWVWAYTFESVEKPSNWPGVQS